MTLKQLRETVHEIRRTYPAPPVEDGVLVMHPETYGYLCCVFPDERSRGPMYPIRLGGMQIHIHESVPRFKRRWEFPAERFFSYGPEDEAWCRYFGIGREVDTTERAFFIVQRPRLVLPPIDWMAGMRPLAEPWRPRLVCGA